MADCARAAGTRAARQATKTGDNSALVIVEWAECPLGSGCINAMAGHRPLQRKGCEGVRSSRLARPTVCSSSFEDSYCERTYDLVSTISK